MLKNVNVYVGLGATCICARVCTGVPVVYVYYYSKCKDVMNTKDKRQPQTANTITEEALQAPLQPQALYKIVFGIVWVVPRHLTLLVVTAIIVPYAIIVLISPIKTRRQCKESYVTDCMNISTLHLVIQLIFLKELMDICILLQRYHILLLHCCY